MSLDGYIADSAGDVDWLQGEHADGDDIDSSRAFIRGIDTVVMGDHTYHQLVTELPRKIIKQKVSQKSNRQ